MRLLDLTLPTLAENLALDEALLLEAESGTGGEILRFWEWPQMAVVLGAGCTLATDVNEVACRSDSVSIFRRASGGGTVLLGPGCFLYSLILANAMDPTLRTIPSSYRSILGRIRDALRHSKLAVELAGISDLAAGGRKFGGSSQQRKRSHLLHHGSLLYRFDLASVGRYLYAPAKQPRYRQGRSHEAFLMNLPMTSADLQRRLASIWQVEGECDSWPGERVRQLVHEKYGRPEWTRRR
jgi:lipoate-protein ligase A